MASKTSYYIRRTHRYFGLIIGIQFLAWTLGGLYFSWSDMDEVHGDYEKAPPALLPAAADYQFPAAAIDSLRRAGQLDSLAGLSLISVLGNPCWQLSYFVPAHTGHQKKFSLADARTGRLRPPLSETEAVAVAKAAFSGEKNVKSTRFLTQTDGHHEYRENPLPAVAVEFDDLRQTTVYVATEPGTVQKFRNSPWRSFDFLWMLHTMDYQSRDDIGNGLLRAFSILGLLTVLSGFALFIASARARRP